MDAKFIDLFAGCGGLSLGLEKAGLTGLFAVEAHPDAFKTYECNLLDNIKSRHLWPNWLEKRAWFAEKLFDKYTSELELLRGKIDLIAGGPPCQGFSMNGRRRPDDPRSSMVNVYLKYVELIRPRLVLLENVVGFQSMKHSDGGTYSDFVCKELRKFGYDVWHEVLFASKWGVPQRRPRFVLIAAQKGMLEGINPFERLKVARKSFLEERLLSEKGTSLKDAISDFDDEDETPILDKEWGHRGFYALKRSNDIKSNYQQLMRSGSVTETGDLRLPRHREGTVKRMNEMLDSCDKGSAISPETRAKYGLKKDQ
ncbi:DNA cytosine methyltransferase [Brucella rhizosphaerae]|uniref:DNA cytosine methyltransferase n=1 Tax=Brucella rhizosphaerae TaxID=571254 RepID=UPI0036218ED5